MRPTAAAPAASEPEIAENMPQTSTVAEPKPPRAQQVSASATSRNLRLSPVLTSTSPVRMNSGTAVSAKWSMPANRLSPRSDIGRTPETTSIATALRADRRPDRHAERDQRHEEQDGTIEIPADRDGLLLDLVPKHAPGPQSNSRSPS